MLNLKFLMILGTVIWSGHWKARHAVVAVPEKLDPQAASLLSQPVKPSEQIIEDLDQFSRVATS